MEYKKNRRYFTSSPALLYVGIALLAVGIVLVIFSGGNMISITLPIFSLPGAVTVVVACALRSSEKAIEGQIETATQHFTDGMAEKFGLTRQEYENLSPIDFGYYDFLSGNVLIRRGNDMTYRSSRYVRVQIICTSKSIKLYRKSFSLTEDDTAEGLLVFPIETLSSCGVEKRTFINGTSKEKETFEAEVFSVYGANGEALFEMTLHGIVNASEKAEEINTLIKLAK